MEMNNMGRKSNNEVTSIPPSDSKESKISYPHLSLSSAQFPEIKDWKVGNKYKICLVVEQKGIREAYNDEDEYEAEFDILEAGSMGKGMVDKEEYDKMGSDEKDDADEKEVMDED